MHQDLEAVCTSCVYGGWGEWGQGEEHGRVCSSTDLVHKKNDLLSPLPDILQEIHFTLCERPIGAHHKQNQVCPGNILLSQTLLPVQNHISAGGVDYIHLLKQLGRKPPNEKPIRVLCEFLLAFLQKLEHADLVCGWQDALSKIPETYKTSALANRLYCELDILLGLILVIAKTHGGTLTVILSGSLTAT